MPSKVCDEITYPFLNFNGWSLGMDKWFHPILYDGYNYLFHAGMLNHVSKRGHSCRGMISIVAWFDHNICSLLSLLINDYTVFVKQLSKYQIRKNIFSVTNWTYFDERMIVMVTIFLFIGSSIITRYHTVNFTVELIKMASTTYET